MLFYGERFPCLGFSEHVLDDGELLADSNGHAAQNDLLQDDAVRVSRAQRAGGHQLPTGTGFRLSDRCEGKEWRGRQGHGAITTRNRKTSVLQ